MRLNTLNYIRTFLHSRCRRSNIDDTGFQHLRELLKCRLSFPFLFLVLLLLLGDRLSRLIELVRSRRSRRRSTRPSLLRMSGKLMRSIASFVINTIRILTLDLMRTGEWHEQMDVRKKAESSFRACFGFVSIFFCSTRCSSGGERYVARGWMSGSERCRSCMRRILSDWFRFTPMEVCLMVGARVFNSGALGGWRLRLVQRICG